MKLRLKYFVGPHICSKYSIIFVYFNWSQWGFYCKKMCKN